MTWTYNVVDLATTPLYQIRLMIGDTDTTDQLLQDEEINWILVVQPVMTYAAADCADIIAASFARQVTTTNGALRVTASLRQQQYADLAKRLRANGAGLTPGGTSGGAIAATPFVGGVSKQKNNELSSDSDNVLPSVALGQDDFPNTQRDANYFSGVGGGD
jgi:hypothetical protein